MLASDLSDDLRDAISQADVHATARLLVAAGTDNPAVATEMLRHAIIQGAISPADALPGLLADQAGSRAAAYRDIYRLLLAHGGEASGDANVSPLHIAAAHGNHDALGVLLDEGALINALNPALKTPLEAALHAGQVPVALALLDGGAILTERAKAIATGLAMVYPELDDALQSMARGAPLAPPPAGMPSSGGEPRMPLPASAAALPGPGPAGPAL